MHYITNINHSNSAGQLPLITTNLRIQKETNTFLGIEHPLNCSVHYGRTLYMKYKNVTACMNYFYICNIALNQKNSYQFCTMKINIC